MDELERRKFELHSQTEDYRSRIERARNWIHEIFDRYDSHCLNYSGGKDSLVLLHLIADSGYSPDIYHFDNGLLEIPGNSEFVDDSVERIASDSELIVKTSEAANSKEMVLEEGHGYEGFWGWYSQLHEKRGWDLRLLGIRAEESGTREQRFDSSSQRPPINRKEKYTVAAPIHHLTTRDIWAYIVSQGLEYHEIYDQQAELFGGMEARGNRLALLYDSEFDSLGARTVSQFVFPDRTNELKEIEQNRET
jgi:3'-phosphoadenosine 5'-phosphosulfate sulfotransferase (PAPS reductase)/FAD synthetase